MSFIYGYGSTGVLPLIHLSVWCTLPLLVPNTRVNPYSKTQQQILLKFKLQGAQYYWERILMCVLQLYQIPCTLATFVNCYRHLSSLILSNQALWLSDRSATLMLVVGAMSSQTYAVMLGCSSSMAGHLVTNRGNSLAQQMGGVTLLIILLAHLQFGKLLHTLK